MAITHEAEVYFERLDTSPPRGQHGSVLERIFYSAALALTACVPIAQGGNVASDRGTRSVGTLEVIAELDAEPSGIAVDNDGRVFVSFPRHAIDHPGPTLARLDRGTPAPFPDEAMSMTAEGDASTHFVSVEGMTLDSRGVLWVIDNGKRAGQPIVDGAAKLVGFDSKSGALVKSVIIRAPALLADSHLNDLRVDTTHGAEGTAFISDSSFGTSPGLIIVDIATARAVRVLSNHRTTSAEPGFAVYLEGELHRYDAEKSTFPAGGIDGLALSRDGSKLYFAPLTSRRLYSILTESLVTLPLDAQLSSAITDEGEKGFADGLATGDDDAIYTTDAEHDAIIRRAPDGTLRVIARDPRIIWPDGIFVTHDDVFVTLGQWSRLPAFNGGHDRREPPYLVVRIPLQGAVSSARSAASGR